MLLCSIVVIVYKAKQSNKKTSSGDDVPRTGGLGVDLQRFGDEEFPDYS